MRSNVPPLLLIFLLQRIFPRIFFPEILFLVMPHPFPYIHRARVFGIGIRLYLLIRTIPVFFVVHDFSVFILVCFTLFPLIVCLFAFFLAYYMFRSPASTCSPLSAANIPRCRSQTLPHCPSTSLSLRSAPRTLPRFPRQQSTPRPRSALPSFLLIFLNPPRLKFVVYLLGFRRFDRYYSPSGVCARAICSFTSQYVSSTSIV